MSRTASLRAAVYRTVALYTPAERSLPEVRREPAFRTVRRLCRRVRTHTTRFQAGPRSGPRAVRARRGDDVR